MIYMPVIDYADLVKAVAQCDWDTAVQFMYKSDWANILPRDFGLQVVSTPPRNKWQKQPRPPSEDLSLKELVNLSDYVGDCVYLIKDVDVTGYYKIGKSGVVQSRLSGFSAKLPFAIELVALIPSHNMHQLEAKLHQRFASKRIRGEWFALDDADVDYIRGFMDRQRQALGDDQ